MKIYLEIQVPIKLDDSWLEELRNLFAGIPVRWQKGYYHITMAFIDNMPKGVDIRPLLVRHLYTAKAPAITFDRLDAFSIKSGRHIIHLGASHVPEDFLALTESIRADMKAVGCVLQSRFMLHVTLGRVDALDAELADIKRVISRMSPPSFNLTLTDLEYRVFRGRTIYKTSLKNQ